MDFKKWNAQQVASVLTSDESLGGAGLSVDDVKPLYEAGFKGTSLHNIVENIQDKDKHYALDQLKSTYNKNSIPQLSDACQSVVFWVFYHLLKPKHGKSLKIPLIEFEAPILNQGIKQARIDPKYEYLRHLRDPTKLTQFEKLIGTNIELPTLGVMGSSYVPKDFNPSLPYLLTRQRFEILKKVVSREKDGFVFSGPHGISKSYTMYLIACYAVVNSIPLLYVPNVAQWITAFKEGTNIANQYLFSLVKYWNSDILSSFHIDSLKSTNEIVGYMSNFIGSTRPVFYLFDEHNEMFKLNVDGKMIAQQDYFEPYTKWTSRTRGNNTITIYCGSAHSSFENYLPGGEESKLIYLVPLAKDEFKTLVKDFGLNPNDQRIEIATGRIPRELNYLATRLHGRAITDDFITSFIEYRCGSFFNRIENFPKHQQLNLLQTLDALFSLDMSKGRPTSIDGYCYDQGLLYRADNFRLYCINNAASMALWRFYCKHNINVLHIRNVFPKSVQGGLMEYGLKMLEGANSQQITYHKILCAVRDEKFTREIVTETIQYSVNFPVAFSRSDLSTLFYENYIPTTTVLVVPDTDNFPCFDYIIIEYAENNIKLYFKQVTISTIDEHYWEKNTFKDFKLLFTRDYIVNKKYKASQPGKLDEVPESNRFSLLEIIIHGVTKSFAYEPNRKQLLHRKFSYSNDFTNNQHTTTEYKPGYYSKLQETIVIGNFNVTWKFIYESGAKTANQSINKVVHSGVLYRNSEEIGVTLI